MTAKPSFPNSQTIHRTVLDNGIIVLVYENFASQSVVVSGDVRVGSIFEPAERAGLAGFSAEMLMRGTQNRSFDTIYETLEGVGANLGFDGGRLLSDFSGSALAEDTGLLLDIAADALINPTFPADHVEKVRGELLTSLHMRANDTRRTASLAFRKLLYGDHPYAQSVSGYIETVSAITRDELLAFHHKHYGPRDMVITIVGAIKADDALALVKEKFGHWTNADQPALPTIPPAPRPAETVFQHVNMADKTQSDIVLGLPGPLRSDPNYQDVRVANTILGVFGMMGRLGKTVREAQGLAYYAYSSLAGGWGPSPWVVSTGVSPDKVQQAIDSIRSEIRRIQDEPVPAAELADSQAYLTGSMPLTMETNRGLSNTISNLELHDLGLDYLETYADTINAITPERVQQAAQTYFSADEIAIAVAGPGGE